MYCTLFKIHFTLSFIFTGAFELIYFITESLLLKSENYFDLNVKE